MGGVWSLMSAGSLWRAQSVSGHPGGLKSPGVTRVLTKYQARPGQSTNMSLFMSRAGGSKKEEAKYRKEVRQLTFLLQFDPTPLSPGHFWTQVCFTEKGSQKKSKKGVSIQVWTENIMNPWPSDRYNY